MKRAAVFFLSLFLGGGVRGGEAPAAPREFDWGFIASRQVDVEGNLRLRGLGPILESSHSPSGQTLRAVRPLLGRYRDPPARLEFREILWPLAAGRTLEKDNAERVLLAFWRNHDRTDASSKYRLWVLPFYFQGRDDDGRNYVALFPFGGRIHDILQMDETSFVLWPLYATSKRLSLRGTNILWPFYNHTVGDDFYRRRVFPFYGTLRKEGQFEKRFILWPFWTSSRYEFEKSSGSGYILFPLWGRMNLTDQRTWWVLPPLFRFTRGDKLNLTYCPWPFFQKESGTSQSKLYFWPFWGRREIGNNRKHFFLWPFFHHRTVARDEEQIRQFTAVPFVQSIAARKKSGTGEMGETSARYFKLWPLMSYQREEDRRRLRFLELWPTRNARPIERNLAPFWTFYEWRTAGGNSDHEVLWGLYRRKTRGESYAYTSLFPLISWEGRRGETPGRSWSFLKGLAEYRREGTQKAFRLLYFLRFRTQGAES